VIYVDNTIIEPVPSIPDFAAIAESVPSTCSVGLLKSFAVEWAMDADAVAKIPFDRFVTGRIPNVEDYPFPYAAIIGGPSSPIIRTDRAVFRKRTLSLHIWVDGGRLEEDGEWAMERARRVFTNRNWQYNYGFVNDVLDHGHTATEINIAEFHYWELVRTMTVCLQQARFDSCADIGAQRCQPASSQVIIPGSSGCQ
jgi:hypothetical protein